MALKGPQSCKFVNVTPPAAKVDAAAFTTATIDTLGYDFLQIVCHIGDLDIAMSAMKVQESDASNMGSPADITGTVVGTALNIAGSTSALPAAGDDNTITLFEIDLRGRKRYIDAVFTGGDGSTGTYMSVLAILHSAELSPVTAAERGCDEILRC